MDKLKEFITTYKVQTMIASVALVVLVVVGVAIGVSQSMSGKEKVATVKPTEVTEIVASSEIETEVTEEEISTEAETEVATEITEEVAEENSSESVVATTNTPTNNNGSDTKTQQPETPQQTPVQETPAPETPAPQTPAPETPAPQAPAPEAPAPAPEEEYDPAAKGLVQDAYGNWVPSASYYVVKEGLGGTKLMSNGSKILGPDAYDIFAEEIHDWSMKVATETGVFPTHEETDEFVYNLCMQ